MNCLYCDKKIEKYSLSDILFDEDLLCHECRSSMPIRKRKTRIEDLEVEYFYDYNSLFKSLLIQYKECFDEALSQVFLHKIKDYIKIRYFGYKILYVPSSKEKLESRGFDHLRLIFNTLGFKEVTGICQKQEMSQRGKGKRARSQMVNNYIYNGGPQNKVLIVDDVMTTGSSLLGVYLAIKPYCKKIKALVLSK